jgi:hypothetical protein
LLLLGQTAAQVAESPPHIEKVQVGLPAGKGEQDVLNFRPGAWAPVYVKIKAGADGNGRDHFKIRVQTNDDDNTTFSYDTVLPALVANQDYIAVGYTRPAGGAFEVALLTAADQPVPGAAPETPATQQDRLEAADVLYLTLGGRPANLVKQEGDKKGPEHFAYIDDISHMPDRWFGYQAADVVILSTGSEAFVGSLKNDPSAPERRQALAEWVRRGGRLIVSVGANRQVAADVLDQMPLPGADKMPLIDCALEGPEWVCPQASNLSRWLAPDGHVKAPENMPFTRLRPGEGVVVLASESSTERDKTVERPVVVEASCGLGRVWLTAFDLDQGPFAAREWTDGQKAFWTKVASELAPRPAAAPAAAGLGTNAPPQLLDDMQRSLEDFQNVPVVNFGWVALFILVYIVIVGPIDYILLTRVFKRPELTWITFPVIVLSISVLVYVVAYSLKGDDLRINKIDLVEYDLGAPQQTYGTSWFTLFSPTIQNYTVGLEPAAPGWALAPAADATAHAVTVSSLDNPDQAEKAGTTALFRKPYRYAEDASGLERVPIPVWSTRSFEASWRAAVDPAKPPVGPDPDEPIRPAVNPQDLLIGRIKNNLPAALQSVTIFYRGQAYAVKDGIPAGGGVELQSVWKTKANESAGQSAVDWMHDGQALAAPNTNGPDARSNNPRTYIAQSRTPMVKELMFHALAGGATMNNSGLRPLDESWRLEEKKPATPDRARDAKTYRDEIVLTARASNVYDRAEAASQDPASATRLWIDRLPDGKSKPPPLAGYLEQETYIRVYIPVGRPKPE